MQKYHIHSGTVFFRQTVKLLRYCYYGNCAAGSKPV